MPDLETPPDPAASSVEPGRVHRYEVRCSWSGSTGVGYEKYDRAHMAGAPPAAAALTLSSDPAFRGDATLLNPEQLLLMAASSCQLLAFLAVAARARVDVLSYEDRAEAEMPEDDLPVRIKTIRLRPRIVVAAGLRPTAAQAAVAAVVRLELAAFRTVAERARPTAVKQPAANLESTAAG